MIDKPAGLAVHPGPRTPRSLRDHLPALSLGFRRAPEPAHRLDRDTSGCLVLGRGPRAVKRLGALFAAGEVEKTYMALLAGHVVGEGVIDAALAKVSSRAAGWRMVVAAEGGDAGGSGVSGGAKPALTAWRALERVGGATLVEFRPRTGRTHQIRVHAAHALAPIIGDPVYGPQDQGDFSGPRDRRPATRMFLHAAHVEFSWRGQRRIAASAPLPAAFRLFGR